MVWCVSVLNAAGDRVAVAWFRTFYAAFLAAKYRGLWEAHFTPFPR